MSGKVSKNLFIERIIMCWQVFEGEEEEEFFLINKS